MLTDSLSDWLTIAPEVAGALATGAPVVALESTIITHGMPHPHNLDTAQAVEAIIREGGAVPATIAVLDGRIQVGIDGSAIERLASQERVMKLSRADLALAVAQGFCGSTTVTATMMAAHLAGIEVFATGGIGGVHRGAERSFDISADLGEFAHTPVITVCAGAKAILDLPATLEVLETNGVTVVGYRTDEFPAFWSRGSGLACPARLDEAAQIARLWRLRKVIGQTQGMIVANPIAAEHEIPAREIEGWVNAALAAARKDAITGKEVTPFLLERIYELSGGRSLSANIALIKANARLAAEIATALAD